MVPAAKQGDLVDDQEKSSGKVAPSHALLGSTPTEHVESKATITRTGQSNDAKSPAPAPRQSRVDKGAERGASRARVPII